MKRHHSLTMPTLFPANPVWGDQRTLHCRETTGFHIPFVTSRQALLPYLPERISVPEEPTVTVTYAMCRGVHEMGGDGYNMVRVGVEAEFHGIRDHCRGDLSLVVWENKFAPAMIGRDLVGAPNLVVDIDDFWQDGEDCGWRVSENGFCFLEGTLQRLDKVSDESCCRLSKERASDFDNGFLRMTCKTMAGPNYADEAVSQICGVVDRERIEEAWSCQGELRWHEVTPEGCYLCFGIVEALSRLPVLRYKAGLITRGSHLLELGRSRTLM
ncbi:acetoacetate decarboxylase family protein [Xanthobacteraceae bacterium Astr-EGSB]|uniref:acetoacetate decarboxylase family protein n=1 Tax=Astrobacterium formosum TaxID=3069710 RepID=UPI0027B19C50|nr:acetoacetate decarboxylase family protein [Xanthobacteraceae bacterium Astr-EGSB]